MHMPPKGISAQHTRFKASIFGQTGPKDISFHMYNYIWRKRVLSNDFKNNLYTHIHIFFNHTFFFEGKRLHYEKESKHITCDGIFSSHTTDSEPVNAILAKVWALALQDLKVC